MVAAVARAIATRMDTVLGMLLLVGMFLLSWVMPISGQVMLAVQG